MTGLLHVADLHYGSVTHSRRDPETGIESAYLSVDRCFGVAVQTAIDRRMDVVVIPGDVFDSRNPDAIAETLFKARLRELKGNGIPVLLLAGNHDGAERPSLESVLDVFHDPPDVVVSSKPEIVEVGGIPFATLPWVSRAALQANTGLGRDEAVQRQTDALVATLGMLRHQAPEGSVLALHWSIEGAVLSSEADISMVGNKEAVIPLAELDGPWDYIAAGHLHRAQAIEERATGWSWQPTFDEGVVGAYSGSIDRRSFGEEGETKVALEVDLDGHVDVIVDPHELPARRFITMNLDGSLLDATTEDVEGAIVRVRGTLAPDETLDREAWQRRLLSFGAAAVYVDVTLPRQDRRRDPTITADVDPLEAFDVFLEETGILEERRPVMRDRAKQLLEDA